jgi:hypothetical protein
VRRDKITVKGSMLMIVPCSHTIEGIIAREYRTTTKFHWQQAVEMGNETTVDKQVLLYNLLLQIQWLPPALYRAVSAELGMTPREYKHVLKEIETIFWRKDIEKRKQAMKAQGPRPRGGFHNPAVEEFSPTMHVLAPILQSLGRRMGLKVSKEKSRITSEALKQRVRRLNLRAKKTGRHSKKEL